MTAKEREDEVGRRRVGRAEVKQGEVVAHGLAGMGRMGFLVVSGDNAANTDSVAASTLGVGERRGIAFPGSIYVTPVSDFRD